MPGDDIPTPAFVYDLGAVRRAYRQLADALPAGPVICYSVKANPHPALVKTLHAAGAWAEVCSPGELAVALEAGVPAGEILYTGPGKRAEDLRAALGLGVRLFSVDSPAGLDGLNAAATRLGVSAQALLRVNHAQQSPGHRLAMTGETSQFGADLAWMEADPAAFACRPRVQVSGLHFYTGTNMEDEDRLYRQFAGAVQAAARLSAVLDAEFRFLDLGGGFAAPFARSGDLPRYPALAGLLTELLDASLPRWRDGYPVIAFESGRYLTATCGRLLVRVLDVKLSYGRQVVVLESGINHLGGMSGLRRLRPLLPDLAAAPVPDRATWTDVLIAGPLCTPLDTWARTATLPACAPGDLFTVPNVGAYGLTASLIAFLGHPTPLEVVTDDGRLLEASRLRLVREPVTWPPRDKGVPPMDAEFPEIVRPFLKFHSNRVISADSRLFDLGLDSMRAVELLFAIEDEYGVELPDDKLNDSTFQTLGSLWAVVADLLVMQAGR